MPNKDNMFIKKITITNFRLFSPEKEFEIRNINTPNGTNNGSGLNVFVGENGSGKTALLDAFALPILTYKTDNFSIDNFNDPSKKILINIYSEEEFEVAKTMPRGSFNAKGFSFEAGTRSRGIKSYLSSIIVNDQKFIRVDSSNPKDTSPDLRVSVNNPFKGKRFNENDVLFLDKNRLFQTRSGNFNTTRFDRLMEDFSYQYLEPTTIKNLNKELDKIIKNGKIENSFLAQAVEKFYEISGSRIKLDFLYNCEPFKNAFFAEKKENNQQITLNNLGSGYEMIFALLYSFYLAQQGGKQLIIFIDEPELHLHPALQKKFVEFLLEFSKDTQIILTSHSPLLVKQLSFNDEVKISVINNGQEVLEIQERVLPYISANETNFLAFNLATEEYHNELFEELKIRDDNTRTTPLNLKDFDVHFFQKAKHEAATCPYNGTNNQVSIHTHLRTQIHHRGTAGQADVAQIKRSIEKMRGFLI